MLYLKTNTATRITVGPFLDKTDGVTPETALTVTSCKLTFVVDDGGVPTLVLDTAPTASGGANDMVHITGDDAGFYDLELAAANVNYLGRARLAITDAATHCPVFHEFMILPAVIYDAMILGTDLFQVDLTQISGDAQSATDLKDFADAGYDPATNKVQGVVLTDTLTTYTGNTVQTGDAYARLGAPAGASVAADVAAVKVDTAAVKTQTDKMVFTTANQLDVQVLSMAANTMTAAAAAADLTTELQSGLATAASIAALNNLSSADVSAAVWNAATATYGSAGSYGLLVETNLDAAITSRASQTSLDTVDDFLDTEIAAIKAKTDGLTFTIAGQVDANIQYVNDIQVSGNGEDATPWNPI